MRFNYLLLSEPLNSQQIDSIRVEDRAKKAEAEKPEGEQDMQAAIKYALEDAAKYPYLFDGPIRYSRHFSPTVGHLTAINDARLYSTWKMYIKGVPKIFGDRVQPWNHNYKAAQSIFQGPTSIVVRSGIPVAALRRLRTRSWRWWRRACGTRDGTRRR